MEKFSYKPKGVCSQLMNFEIEDGIIQSFEAIGGCNGNLKGIACLLKGRSVDEVIETLSGVTCGMKPTSCPDQIAQALKAYRG
jgi:uncharacterized protein (TIGR03905 family)